MNPKTAAAITANLTVIQQQALLHLVDACDLARESGVAQWNFASQLSSLHDLGITDHVLRWLLCKGLIEHRVETTRRGQKQRCFGPLANLHFTSASCFVITTAGAAFAPDRASEATKNRTSKPFPHFDRMRRTLFVGQQIVKRFQVPAANQELILLAFEEENWPCHLDDPLPPDADHDSKRRLHATIDRLNRNQRNHVICFRGDGTGRGLCWEFIADRSPMDRR